ncbi:hypothetical protein SRABI106_04199 [Rahnella aquatilis]|nr:hypothetical protein SRABI106_04199 [Rahnella aquatilis]
MNPPRSFPSIRRMPSSLAFRRSTAISNRLRAPSGSVPKRSISSTRSSSSSPSVFALAIRLYNDRRVFTSGMKSSGSSAGMRISTSVWLVVKSSSDGSRPSFNASTAFSSNSIYSEKPILVIWPLWPSPSSSPAPRISRSCVASAKPAPRSSSEAMASRRLCASADMAFGGGVSRYA